jgi:hypothetical protein
MIEKRLISLIAILAAAPAWAASGAGEDTVAREDTGTREKNVIREEWRGEYLGERKIGYSFSILEAALGDSGREAPARYRLRTGVVIPSERIRMKSRVRAELDENLALRLLRLEMEAQGTRTDLEGSVVDGQLVLRVTSSGAVTERVIPAENTIYVGDVVPWLVTRRGMKPGEEASFEVFDPTVLATGAMTVRVEGWEDHDLDAKTPHALRLSVGYMGIPMEIWIDEDGTLLESRTGIMNMRSVRESREPLENSTDFADLDQGELIREASIPAGVRIPNQEDLQSMTVELRGLPADLEIPSDSWQKVVSRDLGAATLRIGRGSSEDGTAVPDGEIDKALEPSILVQSGDPRIREKAAELVGDATESQEKAKRIATWISREMVSELRVSTPSAVEILESMRGDCNEFSTLYAALARAAGVPARICAGLVHQDGSFFYHAWNEVYLPEEGWTPVDTAFGQFPADPTHIKFAEGDLEEHILIAQLVGKLELSIREMKTGDEDQ